MKTKKEINNSIEVKDKLNSGKLIKIVEFDNSKHNTNPHRHNGYLEIVYLFATEGVHYIDGAEWKIQTPCVLVIRKDNVHHWQLEQPVKGFVVLLKKEFIEQSLDLELKHWVEKIVKYDFIKLANSKIINQILEILSKEQNTTVLEGLFKALLAKTFEESYELNELIKSNSNIYTQFITLLQEETTIINNVTHYASLLNTSSQNLNAACKKNTNLSASEILASHIIKEAKRLIYYTNNTISEISYKLGFSDKSNFSKYFKKHTGDSPKQYKKNVN